ncbi:MAG: hypothetical protein KC502_23395 [Myxococcales bacterium]|nr:hypothetical protein [Myxococcales bacterium]
MTGHKIVSSPALTTLLMFALIVGGCGGVDGPPADKGAEDTNTPSDSAEGQDGEAATDVATTDAGEDDAGATDTGTVTDAGTEDTGAKVEDAGTTTDSKSNEDAGAGDAGPTDAGQPDAGTLPLPGCAKSCSDCTKCADTPMCVNGQTFLNDCSAICTLKAYNWPTGVTLAQGKCPDCKACKTNTKPDAPDAFCAKTKGGAYVPVKQECELECLELANPDKCSGGKCGKSGLSCTKDWQCSPKSEVIKGSCGKFNICMQPKASGGAACPVNEYKPVCSKKDGTTYATACAMQACDLSGCYPIGDSAKTKQCEPGKMVPECQGECYDTKKWKDKCPGDCNPVCAVVNGQSSGAARTFRNGCIAKGQGAAVLSCDGVSATKKDKCSVELYQAANQGACCPDVDYSIVKQVCAAKGTGASAVWYTFRTQSEFDCLTAGKKGDWTFKYLGPCVCNCTQTKKPVCGDDGVTYQNACQAKCYNGDKFNWKDGACGG